MSVKNANDTITLTQAKKYIETLKSDLPTEGQRIIDRKWGGFLEKNAPAEVKEVLSKANIKYADFIEQDKALRKLIDPKTGDYDYDKLYRYTFQRAKTRINSDFKKLMSGLSEVEPEVGLKAGKLYSVRGKRIAMQRNINSLKTNIAKAEELVSKREALLAKYPQRLKGAGKLIGDVGKGVVRGALFRGLGAIGAGMLDQGWQNTERTMGGNPLEVINQIIKPSVINPRGDWRKQLSSDEEFKKWQLANAV